MIKKIFLVTSLSLAVASTSYAQTHNDMIVRPVVMTSKNGVNNYMKGLSLFSNQQYAASLMTFEKALAEGNLTEQNLEVIEFLQVLGRGMLMKENSAVIINGYINRAANNVLRNQARLTAAYTFLELGDIPTAAGYLAELETKIMDKHSRSLYHYIAGYVDLEAKKYSEAYANFEKSVEVETPRNEAIQFYMAFIDYTEGRLDKAVPVFEILAAKPDYPEAVMYLLQARFLQKDYKAVINDGVKALTTTLPEKSITEINRIVGESYFNIGDYANAVKFIFKYRSLGGVMTRGLNYQLGYSYYMQNMYGKAVEQFVQIVGTDDAMSQNGYYHLADSYLKLDNMSAAMQAFSMASSFSFDKTMAEDAFYNYAKLNYELSSTSLYSKKVDVLQKYIDTYPANATRINEIRGYLLTLYLNGSNYDAAMAELSKVKNPSNEMKSAVQRMSYQKGTDYFNDGNYKKATELFDKSLEYPIAPKYVALASFWKAESMFKQGIYDNQVISLYTKYLRVAQPSMTEFKMANYSLAYVYFNNEQWAEAATAFERFIAIYKTQDAFLEDAYMRLGDAMFARKNYSAAQANYKKSSSVGILNSDYADFQRAMSEGLMGQDDMKVKTLRSIASNPKSNMRDQATIVLATTLIKTGKSSEGVAVLEKMTSENRQSPLMTEALLELGVAYSNIGDDDKALAKYKELVKHFPQSSEAKDALVAIKAIYVSKGEAQSYISYIEAIDASGGIDASEKEALSYDALQRQFIAGNHNRVVELAGSYKQEFPKGVHLVDVQYYLVESLIATKSEATQAELHSLINMPNSQYTMAALDSASKFYADKKDYKNQYGILVQIYKISVDPSQKRDVLDRLMELAVRVEDEALIMEASHLVNDDKNASELANGYAHFGVGRLLFVKKDYAGSIKELKQVTLPMIKAESVQAKFLIAQALFSSGDLAGSEKVILEMSKLDTPHQYWVARSFLLYGEIFEKRGDVFQAKATYQSIIDGYEKQTDNIVVRAKERLTGINSKNAK